MKDCEPGSPTWASRIAPSATLSGKLTPPPSWSRAWKKAPWMRHLSGPTCAPLTLQHGVEKWIASLPDSLARTSPSQAAALGLTAPGVACSSTSLTLPTLAVRGASFWRTSQASLLPPLPLWTKPAPPTMPPSPMETDFRTWALKMDAFLSARPPESWENWPTGGGMRSGSLFQRPMWAPATGGQGGSAGHGGNWTTPDVCSGARDMSKIDPQLQKRADTKRTTGLPTEVQNWATPDCNTSTYSNGRMGPNIREQAASWPTPRGTDGTHGGPNQAGGKGDLMLPSAAVQWPTPDANATERTNRSPSPGAATRPTIALAAAQWPTPAARDSKGPNSEQHATVTGGGRKHMDQLANFVAHTPLDFLPLAQPTRDGQESLPSDPSLRRHLNPLFGAWLMGWPSTWAIAEPHASSALETALFRSALQSHLSRLCGE